MVSRVLARKVAQQMVMRKNRLQRIIPGKTSPYSHAISKLQRLVMHIMLKTKFAACISPLTLVESPQCTTGWRTRFEARFNWLCFHPSTVCPNLVGLWKNNQNNPSLKQDFSPCTRVFLWATHGGIRRHLPARWQQREQRTSYYKSHTSLE